jgi:hypothetical protein
MMTRAHVTFRVPGVVCHPFLTDRGDIRFPDTITEARTSSLTFSAFALLKRRFHNQPYSSRKVSQRLEF